MASKIREELNKIITPDGRSRESRRAASNRYYKTDKGEATRKRYRSSIKGKQSIKRSNDGYKNTFGGRKIKRGESVLKLRDYELTESQISKREKARSVSGHKDKAKQYTVLIWYSGELNNVSRNEYEKMYNREYMRQYRSAIMGRMGRLEPSEHFLFDFDLEKMLMDKASISNGEKTWYIHKWWNGEVRHWNVKEGFEI